MARCWRCVNASSNYFRSCPIPIHARFMRLARQLAAPTRNHSRLSWIWSTAGCRRDCRRAREQSRRWRTSRKSGKRSIAPRARRRPIIWNANLWSFRFSGLLQKAWRETETRGPLARRVIEMLNGEDLRRKPYVERKATLRKLLRHGHGIQYVEHADGHGDNMFAAVCQLAAWRESSLRDSTRLIAQAGRKVGSKSRIQIRRLPPGLLMVRSEYSPLSVVRRSGSAAQKAKHTNKNRKTMATNATALCTRVISISNPYSGGNVLPGCERHINRFRQA